ncbi:hypothetical protein CHU98_g3997 [Xylaria longipes]|nr:hypothetical protein CHU98_g3997 [Xylaria longipes]
MAKAMCGERAVSHRIGASHTREILLAQNFQSAVNRQHLFHPTTVTNDHSNTGKMALARGLDKGYKTTARVNKKRVSRTKGHLSRRTAHVRDVVREVMGLAPYERRVIELLRNSKDKRARKLAKKRLGSFQRGKKKVDELQRVIAESRRVGH